METVFQPWVVFDPRAPGTARLGPVVWDVRQNAWRYDPDLRAVILEAVAPPVPEAMPFSDAALAYPRSVTEGEAVWIRCFRFPLPDVRHILRVVRFGRDGRPRWLRDLEFEGWPWRQGLLDMPGWMSPDGFLAVPGHWISPDGEIIRDDRLDAPIGGVREGLSVFRGDEVHSKSGQEPEQAVKAAADDGPGADDSMVILVSGRQTSVVVAPEPGPAGRETLRLKGVRNDGPSALWSWHLYASPPAWTPDGEWVAAVTEYPGIRGFLLAGIGTETVRLTTGKETRMWNPGELRAFPFPDGRWVAINRLGMWVLRGTRKERFYEIPTVVSHMFEDAVVLTSFNFFLVVPDRTVSVEELDGLVQMGGVQAIKRSGENMAVVYGIGGDIELGVYLYPSGVRIEGPFEDMEVSRAGVMIARAGVFGRRCLISIHDWNGRRVGAYVSPADSHLYLRAFPSPDDTFIVGFAVSQGNYRMVRLRPDGTPVAELPIPGWIPVWELLKAEPVSNGLALHIGDRASERPAVTVFAGTDGGLTASFDPGRG